MYNNNELPSTIQIQEVGELDKGHSLELIPTSSSASNEADVPYTNVGATNSIEIEINDATFTDGSDGKSEFLLNLNL